jgi:hypothetical protein
MIRRKNIDVVLDNSREICPREVGEIGSGVEAIEV